MVFTVRHRNSRPDPRVVSMVDPQFFLAPPPPRRARCEYFPPWPNSGSVTRICSSLLNLLAADPGESRPPAIPHSRIMGHMRRTGKWVFAKVGGSRRRNGLVKMRPFLIFFRNGNLITIAGVCMWFRADIRAFSSWYINWLTGSPANARDRRTVSGGKLSAEMYAQLDYRRFNFNAAQYFNQAIRLYKIRGFKT